MPKDIIDVAIGEIGYSEQGNNKTKYGAWYGMNGAAWCHIFVLGVRIRLVWKHP